MTSVAHRKRVLAHLEQQQSTLQVAKLRPKPRQRTMSPDDPDGTGSLSWTACQLWQMDQQFRVRMVAAIAAGHERDRRKPPAADQTWKETS